VLKLSKIKVSLIGIGNCASSFIQGLSYYSKCKKPEDCKGLKNFFLGGFYPSDIEIVAAFDIDKRKVGKILEKAIFADPNNTPRLSDVPQTDVRVERGPVLDGIGESLKKVIQVDKRPESNVVKIIKESKSDIVVNLLPSGAIKATQWYAEQAIKAGCAFVNTTPVIIAGDKKWSRRFSELGLPLVGDDLIDQFGATTLHKTLLNLLTKNGVRITETYQLDVGGGTESLDTMERTKEIKRTIKTKAIEASIPYKAEIVAGSTDYVEFLQNKRDSYFWLRGTYFCDTQLQIDLKLSTVDGPNAGSVLFDVIRATKIAINKKVSGTVQSISAYAFKNPPEQVPIEKAEEMFFKFVS
jgi:myo-inositol-1-phosphate synthase